DLLIQWVNDGTLDNIINETLMNKKADKEEVKKQFNQLENDLRTLIKNEINSLNEIIDNKKTNREMKIHYFDFGLKYSSKCIFIEHNGINILIDFADRNQSLEAIEKINI